MSKAVEAAIAKREAARAKARQPEKPSKPAKAEDGEK